MMIGPNAKWKKFRTLSRHEKRTLLAAAATLPLIWLGLRLVGTRRLQGLLQRNRRPTGSRLSPEEIARIAALVNAAALNVPFPATCLTRSLSLCWTLWRRGVASQLRIGVRLTQGVLYAHAWVEYAGIPINDNADVGERFAAFAEVLPPGAFQSP